MPLPDFVRRPSGLVPTAIAILALAVAASGAAVAVAATQVNIADPTTPSRVAKVDANGRLSTGTPVTTFALSQSFFSSPVAGAVTTPTNATLALTDLTYDNGYNRRLPNTAYDASLVMTQVGSTGSCYDSDRTVTLIRRDALPAGTSFTHSFDTPLVFRPNGSKKYCIGVQINYADTSTPSSEYSVGISLAGYTIAGTYTTSAKVEANVAPKVRHNR